MDPFLKYKIYKVEQLSLSPRYVRKTRKRSWGVEQVIGEIVKNNSNGVLKYVII